MKIEAIQKAMVRACCGAMQLADADEAAGEGELEVAAHGVFLGETDEEEADELGGSPEEDGAAVVEAGVECEEVEAVQGEDEEREEDDAPYGTDEEAAEGVGAAEAVGGELAVLDARHEPADEDEEAEDGGLGEDHGRP